MDIQDRKEALKNAYTQLVGALSEKLETDKVDPEKRKTAMSMYKQAAEDSKVLWEEILELEGKIIVDEEEYNELLESSPKTRSKGLLSVEQRKNK